MNIRMEIDITFDFRSDTPPGKDPDALSPTLRRYHKLLWSKPLPNGAVFELADAKKSGYLYHRSQIGEFFLSSDAMIPSFRKERRLSHVFDQIPPEEREMFQRIGYSIGGMIVFPGNKVDGKMTINGARGCHPRIKDRFDLTIECIRRHYSGESSPLSNALARYADFFELFGDFKGYTDFFLLQELVAEDYSAVKFFMPFEDFTKSPLPESIESYRAYQELAVEFINSRNRRIVRSA
jgi:hypothetical protein